MHSQITGGVAGVVAVGVAGIVVALVLVDCAQAQQPSIPTSNPFTSQVDIEQGEKIFNGRCAGCHGFKGTGGKGTDLAQAILPRATDDASLFRIIRRGIPGTEMPGAGQSTEREIWQVAAYVRSLGRQKTEPITGDAARGGQLFRGKGGCVQCHSVAGQGGRMGPNLDTVGLRRGAAYFRKALLEPESRVPSSFGFVELIRKGSPPVRGIRVNEDTTSIQIRDLSDRVHSFWKHELTEVRRLTGKTPMPSFKGVLSASEIDDLVAYLTSLRENF